MSYAETYLNLSETYKYNNFETIAEVVETHFSDLFQLNVLDSNIKKGSANSSYVKFFDWCMKQLKDLHTPEEVISKLNEILKHPEVNTMLLQHFVFVPPVGNKKSKQLGYLEKLAVGELNIAEPLSYLDMRRLVNGINKLNRHNVTPPVDVVHLGHLAAFTPREIVTLKAKNKALIVNLNKNLKAPAKWGIVDLNDSKVYCESALSETEKLLLDKSLNIKVMSYEGGNANSLISTGYTALAWLDTNITKAWNFDISADFSTLQDAFLLTYFGGDNPGLKFTFEEGERKEFCTKEFSEVLSNRCFGTNDSEDEKDVDPGFILTRMNWLSGLGNINGEKFTLNDLSSVIGIAGKNKMSWDAIRPLTDKAKRSLPPRFNATILAHRGLVEENSIIVGQKRQTKVKLSIPKNIDIHELMLTHEKECRKTNTDSSWLRVLYKDVPRKGTEEEFYATMIVLTLIRSKAKKSILSIDLPEKFQLNKDEIDYIVANLADNPFVTEFEINNNASLQVIKDQLLPVFARNRWLAANGYRPPFVANFWKEAAKYWVTYLHENQNILKEAEEYNLFKGCVLEMGLKGLQEILDVLQDESERETIERIYGRDKPAFYAACPAREYGPYLQLLIKHIKSGLFFPFSELGVSYQPGNNPALIQLIAAINKLDKFDKVSLTDCLKNRSACHGLLVELIKAARAEKWIGLIAIPELEDKSNVDNEIQALRAQYTLLNDLILQNRHEETAKRLNKTIKESSSFIIGERPVKDEGSDRKDKKEQQLTIEVDQIISSLDAHEIWPLKKGGVTQLQLQQQQQIQQSRQVQQEQQKVVLNTVEDPLTGDLIDYHNIDKLLGTYFNEFSLENPVQRKAATLWDERKESVLQGFFHTWINANPAVTASEVIFKMTPEAAKSLLRKHSLLASGLNPDNLPKGFYTQRSKDGELILCYSPEMAHINPPTPMTLNLDVQLPLAEAWKGDFRQIDMAHYIGKVDLELTENDWQNIAFFVQLQQNKPNYTEDYNDFLRANPARLRGVSGLSTSDLLVTHKNKIIKYWPIFIQAWQFAGSKGIEQFIDTSESNFTLPIAVARGIMLEKQPENLKSWAQTLYLDERVLRALGQIYYLHGHETLTLFLTKLNQIDVSLGRQFFDVFFNQVIARSENFNCFIEVSFFASMDKMMEKLSPRAAEGNVKVWQAVLENHMQAVGWDNIDALWRGFDYFLNELSGLDLKLMGDEFDKLPPQNMLVCLDRVLVNLKQIPDQDEKLRFLNHLAEIDLTHGGVHYALVHEQFKHFDDNLKLKEFQQGGDDSLPATYAPDLKNMFTWRNVETPLKMKRAVASQAQFNHQSFEVLADRLCNDLRSSREELLWLIHTQFASNAGMSVVLDDVQQIRPEFKSQIAEHLHRAVYDLDNRHLVIQLDAMKALANYPFNPKLLADYPNGTVLEAVTILHLSKRWDIQKDQLFQLMSAPVQHKPEYPDFLYNNGFKLATLFGVLSKDQLGAFFDKTKESKPVVLNSLRLLINQLLSLDYDKSDLNNLVDPANWKDLLACIEKMNNDPSQVSIHRIRFIERLNQRGLTFKYSKTGEFRALQNRVDDGPAELSFFVDHDERLWNFLKGHIVVPVNADAKEALKPLMLFFKGLQLNRTYLNEVEPLLASLEDTPAGMYWSANYFNEMLRALQPDSEEISFPISLLKVMLQEMAIAAKPIDTVEKKFPLELVKPIQIILQNLTFNRNEQAILCQIALREFEWNGTIQLLNSVISTLSSDGYAKSRGYALEIMAKAKNYKALETAFENCCWLLQHPASSAFPNSWTQTSALWLKVLSTQSDVESLFDKIKSDYQADQTKQSHILHIVANSTLNMGLRKGDYAYDLKKKAPKLVEELGQLSDVELQRLAECYPKDPSPGVDEVLRLIKQHKTGVSWIKCLDKWLRTPYPEPRADYGTIAATRDADLQRMIVNTKVTGAEARASLSPQDATRLTIIFATIKHLESGEYRISGYDQPISRMSQLELATAFKVLSHLSAENPHNDELRAQIWAIMFEVLGRTTRKYPHLAQQFALIANDVCVTPGVPHVLQLATGEGKSHFVAMRAARNAGQGKIVDVCTAKRTLAQRDLLDYKNFFDYLNLKTAFIHSKSSRESYMDAEIHYSTTGDISLFIDEQSYAGTPIPIRREDRVALFDEFDFIRFEEGRKTEYNYARPTGKTPKQMTWFYQAVNEYYLKVQGNLKKTGIDSKAIEGLIRHLLDCVGEHEEKHNLVRSIVRDKLQLVQWLQSAHEAHELQWGGENGFTVREVNIEVGDESYPMREIIPLSSDNQPMFGSTFSAGVHQLLAVRLNTEAKLLPDHVGAKRRAQNFHIHPESNIISSQIAAQRMQQLYGTWDGFSGTISPAQAATLYREQKAEVLHVPTNQNDLRQWHKPAFYEHDKARREALVKQLRLCFAKKQSILFSCKNDAQVKQLEDYLKSVLTAGELAQLIFYTNEEERTPAEVLQDKQTREVWEGGKKQNGIGLLASGFGRGDNVDVEAVFLFDVNDHNDKLQKGGRTARNGEEGEVFQFYLSNEMQLEEARLWKMIESIALDHVVGINEAFDKGGISLKHDNSPESINEHRFERVMLLREYVFTLQNEANQGYRGALAQLSSWGMEHLGKIIDLQSRQELSIQFSYLLKNIDKNWIDISSKKDDSIDVKIKKIEEFILKVSMEFAIRYNSLNKTDIHAVVLDKREPAHFEMHVLPSYSKPTKREKTTGEICRVLTRLTDLGTDYQQIANIPDLIKIIDEAEDEEYLYRFANEIESCKTVAEFQHKLKLAADHVLTPSQPWNIALDSVEIEIEYPILLKDVDQSLKLKFYKTMQALRSDLQTAVMEQLKAAGLTDMTSRIRKILPVLEYLSRFNFDMQDRFGIEYIMGLDTLIQEMPEHLLISRMAQSQPMSYKCFYAIWRLTKGVDSDGSSLDEMMSLLEMSIRGASEHKLRMLTTWEAWAAQLEKPVANEFLKHFATAMCHFKEGVNWDTFKSLIEKTHDWWNKADGVHQPHLLKLWKDLGAQGEYLPALNEYIHWNLKLHGKSWYQNFQAGLDSLPPHLLSRHVSEFTRFWEHSDVLELNKKDKTNHFDELCHSMNVFYTAIEPLKEDHKNRLIALFQRLDGERLHTFMDFISQRDKDVFIQKPQLLEAMLNYLSKQNRSVENIQDLGEALLRASDYQDEHPSINIERLISGLNRFQDKNKSVLTLLLQLLDSDVTVQPLLDGSAEYLANKVPIESRAKVLGVMSTFYASVANAHGDFATILNNEPTRSLFAFDSVESPATRDNRIIWMHLLHHKVLETKDLLEANGFDYSWDKAKNDTFNEACLLHYTKRMEDILKRSGVDNSSRDLTVNQQLKILRLTNEFDAIGAQLNPPGKSLNREWIGLKVDLKQLTDEYKSTWFKSFDRRIIASQLQNIVDDMLDVKDGSKCRYHQVLAALHQSKLDIIDQDMKQNQTRWFKLHRGGQSRLYETITKMEDSVLRHWVQDVNAIQKIDRYEHFSRQEFLELTWKFEEALKEYWHDHYDISNPNYNDKSSQLSRFFSRSGPADRITSLKELLSSFPKYEAGLTGEVVSNLTITLQTEFSILPGHLATLANEVISRGDSLRQHLLEKPTFDSVKDALRG